MRKEIEKKNKEAQLVDVKQELTRIAGEITEKYKTLEALNEQIEAKQVTIIKQKDEISEERKKIAQEKISLDAFRETARTDTNVAKTELVSVQHKIKERTKDLGKINGWVLEAEESYDKVAGDLVKLNAEIAERTKVLNETEDLAQMKVQLENAIIKEKGNLVDILDEIRESLALAQKTVTVAEVKRDEAKKERELEEIKLFNLREQITKQKYDISIYIGRAQIIYAKAFPELEMKL